MTDQRQTCITCRHYHAKAPDDFPSFCGNVWQLRDYFVGRKTRINLAVGWPGKCHLKPAPVEVRSTRTCSHWDVNLHVLQDFEDYCNVSNHWREIREMKERVKAAQKLAVERFRRIKELVAKLKAPRLAPDIAELDRRAERQRKQIAEQRGIIDNHGTVIEDLRRQLAERAKVIADQRTEIGQNIRTIDELATTHAKAIRALQREYEAIIKELRGLPPTLDMVRRQATGTAYVMPVQGLPVQGHG